MTDHTLTQPVGTGGVAHRIGATHVRVARLAALALVTIAIALLATRDNELLLLQVVAGLIAATAILLTRSGDCSVLVLLLVAGAVAAGTVDDDGTALAVIAGLAAACAMAAVEALSLARLWHTAGVTTWEVERRHVAGAARRVGIGTAAAAGVVLVSRLDVPNAAAIAVLGVLAAGLVIALVRTSDT